jgi:hypothetical protein
MLNSYQRNCVFFNNLKKDLSYISKFEACSSYNYQLEQQAIYGINKASSASFFVFFYLKIFTVFIVIVMI